MSQMRNYIFQQKHWSTHDSEGLALEGNDPCKKAREGVQGSLYFNWNIKWQLQKKRKATLHCSGVTEGAYLHLKAKQSQ